MEVAFNIAERSQTILPKLAAGRAEASEGQTGAKMAAYGYYPGRGVGDEAELLHKVHAEYAFGNELGGM